MVSGRPVLLQHRGGIVRMRMRRRRRIRVQMGVLHQRVVVLLVVRVMKVLVVQLLLLLHGQQRRRRLGGSSTDTRETRAHKLLVVQRLHIRLGVDDGVAAVLARIAAFLATDATASVHVVVATVLILVLVHCCRSCPGHGSAASCCIRIVIAGTDARIAVQHRTTTGRDRPAAVIGLLCRRRRRRGVVAVNLHIRAGAVQTD